MTKRHLNRRLFLRGGLAAGGAVLLPLPVLEGMLNSHGTAYAEGAALPKRYITWFFGNGILPPLWVPKTTGRDFMLSEQLKPLADVKEYLTVVSGLVQKFPGTAFHPIGSAASTTGGGVVNASAALPSIDQLVAEKLKGESIIKSLEIGVSDATPNGRENTLHAISHRGPNAPNYPEFDPQAIFRRLFGSVGVKDEAAEKAQKAEQSLLDAVQADAAALMPKLSSADQHRLEAHLDGIRQLELSLGKLGTCNAPANPTVLRDKNSEAPKAVSDVMSEMHALALSCGITNTASVAFTLPAAHVYYRSLGMDMNDDFHDTICHTDAGDASNQVRVNRGVIYAMECLATLLKRMKSLTEGAGTMLDNSLVYVTSCTAWGKNHGNTDWPALLIGKAGGSLDGNLHLRAQNENLSKVLFSIATLMGLDIKSLGQNEGLVNSGLSGLDG